MGQESLFHYLRRKEVLDLAETCTKVRIDFTATCSVQTKLPFLSTNFECKHNHVLILKTLCCLGRKKSTQKVHFLPNKLAEIGIFVNSPQRFLSRGSENKSSSFLIQDLNSRILHTYFYYMQEKGRGNANIINICLSSIPKPSQPSSTS